MTHRSVRRCSAQARVRDSVTPGTSSVEPPATKWRPVSNQGDIARRSSPQRDTRPNGAEPLGRTWGLTQEEALARSVDVNRIRKGAAAELTSGRGYGCHKGLLETPSIGNRPSHDLSIAAVAAGPNRWVVLGSEIN